MQQFNHNEHPHRRYNPLLDEWILVSPHRAKRPWQGQKETLPEDNRPAHDANCYLCAGNTRANGEKNPDYTDCYVFENDFSALLSTEVNFESKEQSLFQLKPERGINKVVCFSPKHNLTLPEMEVEAIEKVVKATGKVMVLHEDNLTGGIGGEISAWIAEHCFEYLDAPVMRCASLDTPIPFNTVLEKQYLANSRLEEMMQRLLSY